MKLKVLIIGLILGAIAFSSGITFAAAKKTTVPSSFVYQAVSKYKNKNYTGCIQDMDYVIQKGHPTDIAYYYKALSYAQLGMPNEAKSAYEQAMQISKNRNLIEYASQAVTCIDNPSACDASQDGSDMTKFIMSNEFMHPDVVNQLQNKSIEKAKSEINKGVKPTESDLKYLNENKNDAAPTDKEIADAVRTLSKLGINPFGGIGNNLSVWGQNSDLAQLNAMFGNNTQNDNNMANLLPLFSGMQSGQNSAVNKDFIQTYMMSQMMPNFNFGNSDK